jgi:KaiC/GvpD/RAD55 family RecA-like ATPase/Flp pilus assembly protein TadD
MSTTSGVGGFDSFLVGGFPKGASIILQGPSGAEKELFCLQFVVEGLRRGESVIVILSSKSPKKFLKMLSEHGIDIEKVLKEKKIIIIDWFSHKIESIKDVQDEGVVLRCSADLKNVSIALGKALSKVKGDKVRAVAEILSPALSTYTVQEVYKFAQGCKAKLDLKNTTTLFLLEMEMHDRVTISSLQQPFDGVVEIIREKVEDRIVRKIGVLSMKDSDVPSRYEVLNLDRNEVWVGEKKEAIMDCPKCGASIAESAERCPSCKLEIKKFIDRLSMIDRQIKLNPRNPNAWFSRGMTLADMGSLEKALKCFETALKLDDKKKSAWNAKAEIFTKMGKHEEAARCYKKALELASGDMEGKVGESFVEEKAVEDILQDLMKDEMENRYLKDYVIYDDRTKRDKNDIDAWFLKAAILTKMGKYKDAMNSLHQVTRIDLKYPEVWTAKGEVYSKLGDHKKAALCYQRAQEHLDTKVACPICGNFVDANDTMCEKCGTEFESEDEEADERVEPEIPVSDTRVEELKTEEKEITLPGPKVKPEIIEPKPEIAEPEEQEAEVPVQEPTEVEPEVVKAEPVVAEPEPEVVEAVQEVAEPEPEVVEADPVVAESEHEIEEVIPAELDQEVLTVAPEEVAPEGSVVEQEKEPEEIESPIEESEVEPNSEVDIQPETDFVPQETEPESVEGEPEVVEAAPEVAEPEPEMAETELEIAEAVPEVAEVEPEVEKAPPDIAEPEPEIIEAESETSEAVPEITEIEPEVAEATPEIAQTEPEVAKVESAEPVIEEAELEPEVPVVTATEIEPEETVVEPTAQEPEEDEEDLKSVRTKQDIDMIFGDEDEVESLKKKKESMEFELKVIEDMLKGIEAEPEEPKAAEPDAEPVKAVSKRVQVATDSVKVAPKRVRVPQELAKDLTKTPKVAPRVVKPQPKVVKIVKPKPSKVGEERGLTNGLVREKAIADRTGKITGRISGKGKINGLRAGKVNGLVNGTKVGRINGLVNGKGKTNGFINGTKVGRINGLVNGKGRINGLINGTKVGRINGLVNGKGRTNGLVNGTKVGRINGLINGQGRVNGLINGIRTGKVDGLVNGFSSVKLGLTNGLTNGRGMTNGLGSSRFRRINEMNKWKVLLIPIIAAMLLYIPYGTNVQEVDIHMITIDGNFDDWEGLTLEMERSITLNPSIDIVAAGVENNRGNLAFYLETGSVIFRGGNDIVDTFHIFIDSDKDYDTGYRINNMGADRMISVYGKNGDLYRSNLREFNESRGVHDWNGWELAGSAKAKAGDKQLEAQVSWEVFGGESDVDVFFYAQSYAKEQDVADHLLSNVDGVLDVKTQSITSEVLSGNNNAMFSLELNALHDDIDVNEIGIQLTGTATPSEVTSIQLYDQDEGILDQKIPIGESVVFSFSEPINVPVESTKELVVMVDVQVSGAIPR